MRNFTVVLDAKYKLIVLCFPLQFQTIRLHFMDQTPLEKRNIRKTNCSLWNKRSWWCFVCFVFIQKICVFFRYIYYLVQFLFISLDVKTYFISLLNFIQHDDAVGILIINHSPEIHRSIRQRHLSNNEGILPVITLEKKTQKNPQQSYPDKNALFTSRTKNGNRCA